MTPYLIGTLLWAAFIFGALPELGQRDLEYRLGWWHPRLMGLVSSVIGTLFGWRLLRHVLFLSQMDAIESSKAIPIGIIGAYFLIEGLLRLGITMKLQEYPVPSLPVAIVYTVAIKIINRGESS